MRQFVAELAPALPDPRCAEVFSQGLTPNPRQVKRTLNIYLLLERLVRKRPELAEGITPVRLAKIVAIQHAHPRLYDQLRVRSGHLAELEAFYLAQRKVGRREGVEVELPRLPEALEPFRGVESLQNLLCLFPDGDDTCFAGLTPLDVRSYITLVRQAAPAETPAIQVARTSFEPELVGVPAGSFLMGTSDDQIKMMLSRYEWAKEPKEKGWFDGEQPQHRVTLPAYEIGRYPVTNAEYYAFVQASGCKPPDHWPGVRSPTS